MKIQRNSIGKYKKDSDINLENFHTHLIQYKKGLQK